MINSARVCFGDPERVKAATLRTNEFFEKEPKALTVSAETYFQRATAYAGQESSDYSTPLIPNVTANYMIDRIRWANKLRQLVTTIPMPGPTFIIPKLTGGVKVYRQREGYSVKDESGRDQNSTGYVSPTVGSITLSANKFAAITGWTTELEEDSIISIPELMFDELADSVGEYEELAFIQGDLADAHALTGEVGSGYDAAAAGFGTGDVRYSFYGLAILCPTATAPYGTPYDTSPDNGVAGGSSKLTKEKLDQALAKTEAAGCPATDIFMRPNVNGRLRNITEFEEFNRLDAIGTRAALIKGYVGSFYNKDIFVSNKVPVGEAFSGTGKTNDTLVIFFDRSKPLIGDRRRVSFVRKAGFEEDVDEVRVTERIGFNTKHNEGISIIWNVSDSP